MTETVTDVNGVEHVVLKRQSTPSGVDILRGHPVVRKTFSCGVIPTKELVEYLSSVSSKEAQSGLNLSGSSIIHIRYKFGIRQNLPASFWAERADDLLSMTTKEFLAKYHLSVAKFTVNERRTQIRLQRQTFVIESLRRKLEKQLQRGVSSRKLVLLSASAEGKPAEYDKTAQEHPAIKLRPVLGAKRSSFLASVRGDDAVRLAEHFGLCRAIQFDNYLPFAVVDDIIFVLPDRVSWPTETALIPSCWCATLSAKRFVELKNSGSSLEQIAEEFSLPKYGTGRPALGIMPLINARFSSAVTVRPFNPMNPVDAYYLSYLWSTTIGCGATGFASEDATHLGQILTRFGLSARIFRTQRNKYESSVVRYRASTSLTANLEAVAKAFGVDLLVSPPERVPPDFDIDFRGFFCGYFMIHGWFTSEKTQWGLRGLSGVIGSKPVIDWLLPRITQNLKTRVKTTSRHGHQWRIQFSVHDTLKVYQYLMSSSDLPLDPQFMARATELMKKTPRGAELLASDKEACENDD